MIPAECMMKVKVQPVASLGIDKSEIPAPRKLSDIKFSAAVDNLIKEYQSKKLVPDSKGI